MIPPPAFINTPLPDFIKRCLLVKSIFNDTPFGMVSTDPFCTITFPCTVELDITVQLADIVQSPKVGTIQTLVPGVTKFSI